MTDGHGTKRLIGAQATALPKNGLEFNLKSIAAMMSNMPITFSTCAIAGEIISYFKSSHMLNMNIENLPFEIFCDASPHIILTNVY